jgi:hypothetical protein
MEARVQRDWNLAEAAGLEIAVNLPRLMIVSIEQELKLRGQEDHG